MLHPDPPILAAHLSRGEVAAVTNLCAASPPRSHLRSGGEPKPNRNRLLASVAANARHHGRNSNRCNIDIGTVLSDAGSRKAVQRAPSQSTTSPLVVPPVSRAARGPSFKAREILRMMESQTMFTGKSPGLAGAEVINSQPCGGSPTSPFSRNTQVLSAC